MKQEAISYIESLKKDILNVSKYIYSNPEDSYKEFKCYSYIVDFLKSKGFEVKEHFLGIDTSFYASIGSGYPKICFICQYDAIPKRGHITAHNAISAISIGASLGLSKAFENGKGTVILLGCPGEYMGGATVTMCHQGVFDDIDAVLMAHPDVITSESGTSSAILPISIEYTAKNQGLNFINNNDFTPLDSMILTFNMVSSIEKGFKDKVTINAALSSSSSSPVIAPDKCSASFYIRSKRMKTAQDVYEKLKLIAYTVSSLMDIDYSVPLYELPYEDLITNKTLSRLFSHNLKEQGIIDIDGHIDINAGLSLGDVSHVCPAIHPYVSIINDSDIEYGTEEFGDATISSYGEDIIIKCAKALACTGIDLQESPTLLKEAKMELCEQLKGY